MSSLEHLLDLLKEFEEDKEADLGTIHSIAVDLLKQFFPEYPVKIPLPNFKLSNETNPRALGVCKWKKGEPTTTIVIQKTVLDDVDSLKRVIAHELIHHWQYLTLDMDKHFRLSKYGGGIDFHGKTFDDKAHEMNSVLGKDYVTVKSDQSYKTTPSTKEFFVLIKPITNSTHKEVYGGYSWASVIRPSADQKALIKRYKENGAKLIKTSDQRLHAGPIKLGAGTSTTRDKEVQQVLKDLYDNGEEIHF